MSLRYHFVNDITLGFWVNTLSGFIAKCKDDAFFPCLLVLQTQCYKIINCKKSLPFLLYRNAYSIHVNRCFPTILFSLLGLLFLQMFLIKDN